MSLSEGIYELLIDENVFSALKKLDQRFVQASPTEASDNPRYYARSLSRIIEKALESTDEEKILPLVNELIQEVIKFTGLDGLAEHQFVHQKNNLLTAIGNLGDLPRPITPLSTSSLLTGQGGDPTLEHELRTEMSTADEVHILISFIKWSGLRLLIPAFEKAEVRGVPIKLITTSYMGASDPEALAWLAQRQNIQMAVSYDTACTRLHAKAYLFKRKSGFSTAYIGSANMSHSAMTQGLEWTLKVTAQDLGHVLERFKAEFMTYWENEAFERFSVCDLPRFKAAITRARNNTETPIFLADIHPHPFQERILEALQASRLAGSFKNLVVSATGTGKTVISALDFRRSKNLDGGLHRLLFVAHRKEILEQAQACFRTVLKDPNFGELWRGGEAPEDFQHIFTTVQTLSRTNLAEKFGANYFDFIIVDEAHHGTASSYRPIFQELSPKTLLGLTATPERTDGSSILPDFDNRLAAEIRLPEALEEKLLCPFHYFGVTDTIDLNEERFWKNGKYSVEELDRVYTGDDVRALQRVDNILKAIYRYQPDLSNTKCIGFCSSVRHAHFMANQFRKAGLMADVLLGETKTEVRDERLKAFREGELSFLFTRDVLSEGVDVPDINMVLFLRPTESLTVFLQQLGRGLRHHTGKECLTVLDFVGNHHPRYRIDQKLSALLAKKRTRLDLELENDFPSLPAGCSIQLEKVAREYIVKMVRRVLQNMKSFVPEVLRTWEHDQGVPLTFGHFIDVTQLSPVKVLSSKTWSQWKETAGINQHVDDPDLQKTRRLLVRLAQRSDPELLKAIQLLAQSRDLDQLNHELPPELLTAIHYMIWTDKASSIGVKNMKESIQKLQSNPTIISDALEVIDWRLKMTLTPITSIDLPYPCWLKLHAEYGYDEIKAAFGLSSLDAAGSKGVGVLHNKKLKTYIHLVTFRKADNAFSPTTRYRDYPISKNKLHWESQSTTTQRSVTGQDYIHFKERNYTILFFARVNKKEDGETCPFIFIGPAKNLLAFEGDRPISMTWELDYSLPSYLFEEVRPA